jgi:hypothetical protein
MLVVKKLSGCGTRSARFPNQVKFPLATKRGHVLKNYFLRFHRPLQNRNHATETLSEARTIFYWLAHKRWGGLYSQQRDFA